MASLGIWTIRLLRRLPHTRAFDEHLTRCAFAEILAIIYLTNPGGQARENLIQLTL